MKKLLVLSAALLSVSSFAQTTEIGVNYNNTLPSVTNPYANRPSFSISTNQQMQMREVTVSPFPGVYIKRQEPFFGNSTKTAPNQNQDMTDDQMAEMEAQEEQMRMLQNNTPRTALPNMPQVQPLTPNAPIGMLDNNVAQKEQPQPQRQGQVPSEIKHTYTKDLSSYNQSTIIEMEQRGRENLEREYRNFLMSR